MAFATILVHDPNPGRARRIPGSVLPALDDLGVEPRISSFVSAPDAVDDPADAELVVVMGSVAAAYDDTLPWLAPELAHLRRAVEVGTPVLGICFGGQALARVLGGTVGRAPRPERGFVDVEVTDPDAIPGDRWMQFHGDAFTLPPDGRELARSEVCLQGFAAGPHVGVQFHPEITPDVFRAWGESFAEAGGRVDESPEAADPGDRAASGLPTRAEIDAIVAEIEAREQTGARACRELVTGFLDRAQQPISRAAR